MSLLVLLFSWEVPLASRVLPKNIIEVFLVEGVVKEKLEEKNLPKVNPAPPKVREKINLQKISRVALTNSEENKKNQIQEKTEAKQFEDKEEKKPVAENASSEERALRTNGEDPLRAQAKFAAQMAEGGRERNWPAPKRFLKFLRGEEISGRSFWLQSERGRKGRESNQGKGRRAPVRPKKKGPPRRAGFKPLPRMEIRFYPKSCPESKGPNSIPNQPGECIWRERLRSVSKSRRMGRWIQSNSWSLRVQRSWTRLPWKRSGGLCPCLSRKDG